MDKDYYFTEIEWARPVVPPERPVSNINEQHWNGEQQLNKVTGQVEVYYNGMWTVR
jgi:hypothetical protein